MAFVYEEAEPDSNGCKLGKGTVLTPLRGKTWSASASGRAGSRCVANVIGTWIPSPSLFHSLRVGRFSGSLSPRGPEWQLPAHIPALRDPGGRENAFPNSSSEIPRVGSDWTLLGHTSQKSGGESDLSWEQVAGFRLGIFQKKEDVFLSDAGFLGQAGDRAQCPLGSRGTNGEEQRAVPAGPSGWSRCAGDSWRGVERFEKRRFEKAEKEGRPAGRQSQTSGCPPCQPGNCGSPLTHP